jgi:CheY-like chemotaxis protein
LARILYVDDEEVWLEVITKQLRDHHVDAVRSYEEALDKLQSGQAYDVALVDLNLRTDDDGEGGELLDMLLHRYPATKRIAVTGKPLGGAVLRRIITRYGIEELIVKRDVLLPDLRRTVEEAITGEKPGERPQSLRLNRSNLQQRFREWQGYQSDRLENKLRAAEDHLSHVTGIRGQIRQQAIEAADRARERLTRFREASARLREIVMDVNSQVDFDAALTEQERAEEEFSDDSEGRGPS